MSLEWLISKSILCQTFYYNTHSNIQRNNKWSDIKMIGIHVSATVLRLIYRSILKTHMKLEKILLHNFMPVFAFSLVFNVCLIKNTPVSILTD